jgi:two-component system chemotaxis response regulator CheY
MYIETPSLLITDDDRALRQTLGSLFAERGFRTFLAEDGEEAIEIVERETIHVAVLDMHMPRMTGLEIVEHFHRVRTAIPWILLSGGLDEDIIDTARSLDAFSVMSKPFSCVELTSIVRRALKSSYDWSG